MWTYLGDVWPWLTGILNVALATAISIHVILWKRDPRAATAWVGVAWLAPLVGGFLYLCFGINRIQRKAVSLRVRQSWNPKGDRPPTQQDVRHREALVSSHPNLLGLSEVVYRLTGRPLLPGNAVEPLVNGDEAYPAMLASIDQAQRSVALMSYIFDNDRAGRAFLDALLRARDRGVEVRVLIDDVGARYSRRPTMLHRLKAAGLKTVGFLPTRLPWLFKYANLHNHRKILVVDGMVGYTGGTNIREGHWLSLDPKSPVQCVHFAVRGPVVAQLQEAFAVDWAFASGESLSGKDWFPSIDRAGPVWARGISDGPDEDFETISDAMLGALSAATRSIRIVSPYFLPHTALIRALNVASLRGVDVRILLPSRNNIPIIHWAAQAQLWQLLEKGCRVFLTPPPFDHSKLLVIDDVWTLLGSTNWDPRSLRLNFEFNVECYDESLAERVLEIIDRKARNAREITLDEVDSRRFPIRFRDGLARLLTPFL